MKLIDTHCHLVSNRLKDNVDTLLENARAAGVSKIIDIAYDPETVDLVCEQISKHDMLYAAVGIQPHDALTYSLDEAERIKSIAQANKKVVAIGEIGLDDYHKLSPMEKQIECFEHFLQIAVETKLPVVVHVRETHRLVADRIRAFSQKGLTGVIHCFTGTKEESAEFLDLGMYISFSGIVTFKNSDALREVAKFVPLDRMLVETDSPYLAPIPHRGKTNEPAWVRNVCECIASERGIDPVELSHTTTRNAETLFYRLSDAQ